MPGRLGRCFRASLGVWVCFASALGCNRDAGAMTDMNIAALGDMSGADLSSPDLVTCHEPLSVFCNTHTCRSWQEELEFARTGDASAICVWVIECRGYHIVAYWHLSSELRFYDQSFTLSGAMTTSDIPLWCDGSEWRYGDVPEWATYDSLAFPCQPDGGGCL